MGKIFKYELRRLILNKFFIGLLLINAVYAWHILTTDTIAGIAYSAPFSPWSFGAYLGATMPFAILTVFFLLTVYYSKKEKQVAVLTSATPVAPLRYALVRSGAAAVCFLLIMTVIIGLSVYFYISFFDYSAFMEFIIPALVIPLPCFVFALGIGHLAGRIHPILLYVLMIVVMTAGFTVNDSSFDFFGNGYFSSYPKHLPVNTDGEPLFTPEAIFWAARFMYLTIGAMLLTIGIGFAKRKARKA